MSTEITPPKPPHGRLIKEGLLVAGLCPECGSSSEWDGIPLFSVKRCIHPDCDYRSDRLNGIDIRTNTYSNATNRVAISMLHIPTNITVWGEGISHFKLRRELRKELEQRVKESTIYVNGKW